MMEYSYSQNRGSRVDPGFLAANQGDYSQTKMLLQDEKPKIQVSAEPLGSETAKEKRGRVDELLLGVTRGEMRRVDLNQAEMVRRQYLSHLREAIATIRPNGIEFNNACIAKMLDTYYIQFYIDRNKQLLIIRSCDEDDKDGQKWCNEKNGKRKSRKITGKPFAEKLYKMMGWSKGYYYKVFGTPALQIDNEDELLFVFELNDHEDYALTAKGRKAAGVSDEELTEEELQKLNEEEAARKATRKKKEGHDSWDPQSFGPNGADHVNRVIIPRIKELEASTGEEFGGRHSNELGGMEDEF